MADRQIYLQIETIPGYSPLAPIRCSRQYGLDCMRNPGHEIGRVTPEEIFATTFDAVVYRQYRDAGYTRPVKDKLVKVDANEPPWNRRVPGCVLYADVGDDLEIHVRNSDPSNCHSFHLHGVHYGIDSDGAWPLGVASRDGRRSDQILPADTWTYRFKVTADTIGVWAFHDHFQMVQRWANRGLFGALIVRDPEAEQVNHEIPLFVHELAGDVASDGFESPLLANGQSFAHVFGMTQTTYPYHCKIHGITMAGIVQVTAGAPMSVSVVTPPNENVFVPASIQVAPGGTVTWFNSGQHEHIVFAEGGGGSAFCLNGRSYVGNTPTIVADAGQRLRWYLLNLDLNGVWHNVHTHAARWRLPSPPGGAIDVHPLSPTEGFVTDTEVPHPLLLSDQLEELQQHHPKDACRVTIRGDFLFHCHIEEHMMQGLAGLVRAREELWVTEDVLDNLEIVLPYDDCSPCAPVDGTRTCMPAEARREMPGMGGTGMAMGMGMRMPAVAVQSQNMPANALRAMNQSNQLNNDSVLADAATRGCWELLPCDSQALAVHAAVLHDGRVLMFSGSGNLPSRHLNRRFPAVLWEPESGRYARPPIAHDVFCGGQAFLPSGDLIAAGGTKQYEIDPPGWQGLSDASVFDARREQERWRTVENMADGRWYPTLISLGDGSVCAFSGYKATSADEYNHTVERFDPDAQVWETLQVVTPDWPLYPHLFLLADGRILFTGASSGGVPPVVGPQTLDLASNQKENVPSLQNWNQREYGASVLLPPAQDQRVMVISGGGGSPFTTTKSVDIIDMRENAPSYKEAPSLHYARTNLNAVLLPDRTVLVTGGNAAKLGGQEVLPVLSTECYDPESDSWTLAADAHVSRMYHSVAVLLPSGEVLTAGSNPDRGDEELRMELFHPPYLFRGPRPVIEEMSRDIDYGQRYKLHTPNALNVQWVQLIRPMATTHSCDTQQRLVDVDFEVIGPCDLRVVITQNVHLAPPGWWMMTIVDKHRIPSVAYWVHLTRAPASG